MDAYERPREREKKKVQKGKSCIQNSVDDKTGSGDIANAFSDQYSIIYSCVPSEPNCFSALLVHIKTYVRNVYQYNY